MLFTTYGLISIWTKQASFKLVGTSTSRRDYKTWISLDAIYEMGPHVHVSFPSTAASWQFLDRGFWQNVRPHIHICQASLEWLCLVKLSSRWVLFLAQHQRPLRLNYVPCLETRPSLLHIPIFVEFPFAITVLPGCTDLMPFTVISWNSRYSARIRNKTCYYGYC